jgi:ATP-binding cassette subfamily F protein uup
MDYRAEMQALREEERRQEKPQDDRGRQDDQVRTGTGLTKQEKNELKKLEREISELEGRKAQIHEAFTQADLGLAMIEKLSAELKALTASLEEKELRWLELSDR